jgi:hypothetical protein
LPDNFHVVFDRPPTGVSDEEFNAWALKHDGEVLAVAGWVGARRFRLEPHVVPQSLIPFSFMSLYELEGTDPLVAVEAENEQTASGRIDVPDWMERARQEECFAAWTALALSKRIGSSTVHTPLLAPTLYLVFNRPPVGVANEEFNAWAITHFDEILAIPGWISAQRFRLEPSVLPESPIPFPFMSLYELEGDPLVAVKAMREESKAGWMDFPQWFEQAEEEHCFASWICVPLRDRVASQAGLGTE